MAAYDLYDEEDVENGDGTKDGDGNIKEFDWMDFRLKFGCQSKVRMDGILFPFDFCCVALVDYPASLTLVFISSIHRQ